MKLGLFELNVLHDGYFRLDGGAMFGVVPKTIWDRLEPADDFNRILLGSNPLLVRTGSHTVLIDTGIGSKFDSKYLEIYQIELPRMLIPELNRLEVLPESVDFVICTHLHFDHIGGNTFRDPVGVIRPTFPNAKYVMQKTEYEDALSASSRTQASYHPDDIVPLQESGQLHLIDGDEDVIPGIKVRVTGGHTRAHSIVQITSENETALYLADLIPTPSHIKVPYVMGYDLFPAETANYKEELLKEAAEGDYLLVFEHAPRSKVGRVFFDENVPTFNPEAYD
ncbi:MAG: MBL fold metallo-hydrolase [bacterium]|nr:MBL fold metallo-hydrolase [bacterium]